MEVFIEVEKMILEIRERPILWDTSLEVYRDKNKKKEGWNEVFASLFGDFENRRKDEKLEIEKAVQTKWRTVRDGYVKWKKRGKELTKSGAKRRPSHKYVYADLMAFLNKCMVLRETEGTSAVVENSKPAEFSKNMKSSESHSTPSAPRKMYAKKRKTIPPIEKEMSSYLQTASKLLQSQLHPTPEDEDMAFFKSILSSVKKLNESQKFQFRMQIMQNLQILTSNPNISRIYETPTIPFNSLSGSHPLPFQQQQPPSVSFQPQYNSTLSSQLSQTASTSYHYLEPQIQTRPHPRPDVQSSSSSSSQQHPYSPAITSPNDSNLTFDDFNDED